MNPAPVTLSPVPRSRSRALLPLVLASWLLLLLVTINVHPFASRDHVFQLKALEEYLAGQSPSLNHLVQPDPADLSRDRVEFLTWWSPGTQLTTYPLRLAALSLGVALHVLVLLCLLAGAAGWIRWYSEFSVPRAVLVAVALLFPWLRLASANLFTYSAEILVFASAPWLLLASWRAAGRAPAWAMTLLGVALGMTYVLKYSEVLLGTGCLAGIFWIERTNWRRRVPALAGLGAGFLVPIGILTSINYTQGSSLSLVTSSWDPQFRLGYYLSAIGNPVLMLADLQSPLSWLLMHPRHGVAHGEDYITLAGLLGAPVLIWLLWDRSAKPIERFAAIALATSMALLLVVWTVSWGASHEPRHLTSTSLGIAPAALAIGSRRLALGVAKLPRFLLGAAFLVCWLAPLVYGVVSVVGKIESSPAMTTTRTRLRDPIFLPGGQAAGIAYLQSVMQPATDVWILGSGNTTFELPGRHRLEDCDSASAAQLARQTYRTSRPVRIVAMLDRSLESDGRGALVRGSCQGVKAWEQRSIPGTSSWLWIGWMQPTANP